MRTRLFPSWLAAAVWAGVAGVEVVTKTQGEMLSIEQLRPLAEKMVNRF